MDLLAQVFSMWEQEIIFVIALLASIVLINYSARVWIVPRGLVFISMLGASFGAILTLLYFIPRSWTIGISRAALLYIVLYAWCVLGMLFFARTIHPAKLLLGLVAQAGILYALFRYL